MTETTSVTDLPPVIPVFPLPGVILLPGRNLPLNIFEPRYLQMVRDAMATHRIIGMIQPREAERPGHAPALFDVGGAGFISDFKETEDGRILIRLKGLARFRVREELSVMTPYRQVQADWIDHPGEVEDRGQVDGKALIAALKAYLEQRGLAADYDAIAAAPDSVLVNSLAMILSFGAPEKQALLEAADVAGRARLLSELFAMAAQSTIDDGPDTRH